MKRRLKEEYQKDLWIFLSVNIVIYIIIYGYDSVSIENINLELSNFLKPKSFLFILSPIITIIINGLIPNPIKEFLVFWRINNRLPGHRAFSVYAKKDPRINIGNIEKIIGKIPEDYREQNEKWYLLYTKVKNDNVILGSHKDFILTRDLCWFSFIIFLTMTPIAIFTLDEINITLLYILFLIIQYLSISISSKYYGRKFVCNVLANISTEEK